MYTAQSKTLSPSTTVAKDVAPGIVPYPIPFIKRGHQFRFEYLLLTKSSKTTCLLIY